MAYTEKDVEEIRKVRDGLIRQLSNEKALTHQLEKFIRNQAIEISELKEKIIELSKV